MFLWSGKIEGSRKAPVAWDRVCDPKKAGGLNIISLKEWNAATMIKLLWNVQAKKDKLWVKWINAYYIKGQDVQEWQIPHDCSWIIKQIMKSRGLITNDPNWRMKLDYEKFKTRDSYELLRETQPLVSWRSVFYANHARPRALFHLWLLMLGRIPTKDRLVKFGVQVEQRCCFCIENESIDHLFFQCSFAKSAWGEMLIWMGYHRGPEVWSIEKEWITAETKKKGWKRSTLKIAVAETSYMLWKHRNEVIFNHTQVNCSMVADIKYNVVIRSSMNRKLMNHIDIENIKLLGV
ncbi:uncharacterized protein LOC131637052 [Vicia villosa]|uniref:uncharacterized protein LOC131637052 n=1 Tax=Vicia villosa TaxID=3911 RepID=UPI00273BD169|nr:uncharacterized protein LOC131637052 [Vicia villosa]